MEPDPQEAPSVGEAIERGIALYAQLVRQDPGLRSELDSSAATFSSGGPAETPEASRRHLEWFLFDRPSDHLGGVPVEVLRGPWLARVDSEAREQGGTLLESRASAFEVTSVHAGGLWVVDLFGLGEYPVDEAEAAAELEVGDLLVGRIFPPSGDGLQNGVSRLSPAVGCFRNPALREALRADVERLRASRRGNLRVAQNELERLFFRVSPVEARGRDDALARGRTALLELGLEPGRTESTLEALQAAAAGGLDPVTEILNELAFDTDVDLERCRRILAAVWAVLRATPGGAQAGASGPGSAEARAALEEFDEGELQGRNLEERFRLLEERLQLDPEPLPADDLAPAPDFPGVVGAMVEEFLWDTQRERGSESADAFGDLRRLGEYGQEIGVFENLGPRHLLDFCGRWLLDERPLQNAAEAGALLDALGEFCRWCEERHLHPLWKAFAPTLEGLRDSLPRIVAGRALLPASEAGLPATAYEVLEVGPDRLRLCARDEDPTAASIPAELAVFAASLRPGDWLRASVESDGAVRVSACYPPEVAEIV